MTFIVLRKTKGKKVYEPLQPQPTDNEILTIHRYYAFLKADNTYKNAYPGSAVAVIRRSPLLSILGISLG